MKKKIISMLICGAIMMSFAGCGSSEVSVAEAAQENVIEATVEPTVEPTQIATQEPAKAESIEENKTDVQDNQKAAVAFVANIKAGWNLGNTLDPFDCNWIKNDVDYETAWQGAKTTPEMIQLLKEAGFNAIRIPVSWHNHIDAEYNIDAVWMNRVNEIVDYCYDEGLYVILNTHHDIYENYIYPTEDKLEQSNDYLNKIWTQIAERFKDYDDKLIFEGFNECRLKGTEYEWWIPDNDQGKAAVKCINSMNQTFVDTVRASGGNNATRFLGIQGYAGSPDGILHYSFNVPNDINDDPHLFLVVHMYTPYSFALDVNGTDKWSRDNDSDTADIKSIMQKIYLKYIGQGTPVIIDEMGNVDKNNLQARIDNAAYFVEQASICKMPCFWWDNHNMSNSGEKFTILDRKKCEWLYPEIKDVLVK